jgi:hypothetical protein
MFWKQKYLGGKCSDWAILYIFMFWVIHSKTFRRITEFLFFFNYFYFSCFRYLSGSKVFMYFLFSYIVTFIGYVSEMITEKFYVRCLYMNYNSNGKQLMKIISFI